MRVTALVVVSLVLAIASARAAALPVGDGLRAATVALEPRGCTGVVVDDPSLVATALHCVDGLTEVRVRPSTGATRRAWVVAVDRVADQAILLLDDPAAVAPLSLAPRTKPAGTTLWFGGHPSRLRFREARLEKVGRCPSLPSLPDALFTTIDGTPGDSGAPVLDADGRVVGLVHGGARCQISTPARTLQRLIDRLLDRPLAA